MVLIVALFVKTGEDCFRLVGVFRAFGLLFECFVLCTGFVSDTEV